jgi:hypothetical protein
MATPVAAHPASIKDDVVMICAISVLAFILADVLHEAVGHALLALITGAQSGVLSTVAWSSAFDSRLVAAGGTLVNLASGIVFWVALRSIRNASAQLGFFLLLSSAFNLFDATGYFFFSGVTDFGDWAAVIAGAHPHWFWRALLVLVGIAAYYGAVLVVGRAIVRYVGVPTTDVRRLRKLTVLPYISAILVSGVAGLLNPVGLQLVWQSALPATAGANCGLLWMRHYIPKGIRPERTARIERSYTWIGMAAVLALAFVFVLGPGIKLHR